MKKLFLDDIRTIEMVYDKSMKDEFDIVRSYDEFVDYIRINGLPEFISFDNDLGLDKRGEVALDGYAAAKWLVYKSGLDLRKLKFKVHSANPVAAEQIKGLLSNYIKHLSESITHQFSEEFRSLCQSIRNENLRIEQWRLIESDDQFRTQNYCGGFDATEDEFTFSWYDDSKNEHWFQLSLEQIELVTAGLMTEIETQRRDT